MKAYSFSIFMVCVLTLLYVGAWAQQSSGTIPDITGSWERAQVPSIPPRPQPPLKAPYLKEWQAKMQRIKEAEANGQPIAERVVMCLPEGMPGMMAGPFPFEFLQTNGQLTIIQEAYTQVRRIALDQTQKAIDDVDPGFYGHTVAYWQNGTLIADTVGVKEDVTYQNVPHSKEMHVKERIFLGTDGFLRDELTVEDPVFLEKPWSFTFGYRRRPNYQLLEYICEDNREYADQNGVQRIRVPGPER